MTQKRWIVIGISTFIILMIGVSYAYWHVTKSQEETNQIASGCLDIELVSNSKEIKLENAYPILNSEGVKLSPYTFTITNTCSIFARYELTLNILLESTLKSQYIAAVLDQNDVKKLSEYEEAEPLTGYQESRILQSGFLASNESVTFDLRLWIDESVTIKDTEAMNRIFQGKIGVTATPSQYRTLADTILQNEYPSLSVEQAKNQIKSKPIPDFSKPAPFIEWQENPGTDIVTTVAIMPHPNKVGEYQGFTNIEQSYVGLSNAYTFDPETGKYTLTELFLVDPTTITDYDTKDYYFCSAGTWINADDMMNPYQNYENCSEIYKVTSVTKEDYEQTGLSGTSFQMIQYILIGNRYNQIEFESDRADKGLFMALDDDGESYYYRGSVSNNYVKFAEFYWRIIRLNGDGSIRLLYAGDSPTASGRELSLDKKRSAYNIQSNLPGYVGYKYGNSFDTYQNVIKNEQDSTIKTVLDNWYQKNIIEKGYHDRIADSIFCNDRELQSGDGVSTTQNTNFQTNQRLVEEKSPTFECHQEGDRFTVSEKKGNGSLTYPIGLITSDELQFAGMTNKYINKLSYVYSNEGYWSMSSGRFSISNGSVSMLYLTSNGYVSSNRCHYENGVRAVINLKPSAVIISGNGTVNNPFVVE
ncbi:MAG: hypothetical protein HFH86_02230 [Bacilli bacterium]|nr:hypothetical protein [Bacilli bacterium]